MNHKQRREQERRLGIPKQMSKHHRKTKLRNGTDADSNISIVPVTWHQAYHTLFWDLSPQEIARMLNEVWIDPSWRLVVVRR